MVGLSPLAEACGVTYQAVRKWEMSGAPPAERVFSIFRATRGAVVPNDLRPDLYPDPTWLPPLDP